MATTKDTSMSSGVYDLYPIKAQGIAKTPEEGKFKIPDCFGKEYHKAMEQGRWLEQSIGEAQAQIELWKKQIEDKIKTYIRTQLNALTCAIWDEGGRAAFVVKDIIDTIMAIISFIKEVITTIKSLIQIIQLLQALVNRMIQQLQAILNAIANLINMICNWHLPPTPSIPNIFGDLVWGFNGFQLSRMQLQQLKFDKNFAFGQCVIQKPSSTIFNNYPTTVQPSGGIVFGNQVFNPALGSLTCTLGPKFIDETYIKESLAPKTKSSPILTNNFTVTDFNQALPSPASVINNFFIPPTVYKDYIVSLLPNLAQATSTTLYPLYEINISLDHIVASNYDPNTISAWVFYLDASRNYRAGNWIPEFKSLFLQAIQPSLDYLNDNTQLNIPYNFFNTSVSPIAASGFTGGEKVVLVKEVWTLTSAYPTGIVDPTDPTLVNVVNSFPLATPFIRYVHDAVVNGFSSQGNLLWRLSWIEASLLGYHRSTTWDAYADSAFLSPITQTDLDYRILFTQTELDAEPTSSIILSQSGKALYPPTINFPTSILGVVQTAITKGEADIEANPAWRTSTQYRYIYDQFAQQHEIDRYSQFWREWAFNFSVFLKAGVVVPYAISYWQMVDSACNPLGDKKANYLYLKYDAENRNGLWYPGFGLPEVYAPSVITPSEASPLFGPTDATNGWNGDILNDAQFLARPDIANQPVTVQMAMLDINKCYASLLSHQDEVIATINTQISEAQVAAYSTPVAIGFAAQSSVPQIIPPHITVEFVYDLPPILDIGVSVQAIINNIPVWHHLHGIITPELYPGSSDFTVMAYFSFPQGTTTSIKASMMVNGQNVANGVSAVSDRGILECAFSSYITLHQYDTISFLLSHSGSHDVTINPNSIIAITSANGSSNGKSNPLSNASANPAFEALNQGYNFQCGANIPALSAVFLDANGELQITDPTRPDLLTSGSSWLNGVSLLAGIQGSHISIAGVYGKTFIVEGANFSPGSLLYVQSDGLISSTIPAFSSGYRIVVGQATGSDSFTYQPQLPISIV